MDLTSPEVDEPPSPPATSDTPPPPSETSSPASPESGVPPQPTAPAADSQPLQQVQAPQTEQNETEQGADDEPLDLRVTPSPLSDLLGIGADTGGALTLTGLQSRDVGDILNEVIRAEREKADEVRSLMSDSQANDKLGVI